MLWDFTMGFTIGILGDFPSKHTKFSVRGSHEDSAEVRLFSTSTTFNKGNV